MTSNHVVAIYRQGNQYAYFDSNVAFVQGLRIADGLIKVVDKAVKLAGYKVEDEGFLVEHFDTIKADHQLTAMQETILTKPVDTAPSLFALEDEKLGAIEWDGRQIPRIMFYDAGAKLSLAGSVLILIHTGMDLSHANLVHYLATGKLTIEAIAQVAKNIPLSGSQIAVKNAKAIQELVLNMNEISIQIVRCLGPVACSIYDIDYESV